jgi:cytoskeletal protein RodZ
MTKAGEKLQQARLEKGLTLEDVAKSTKIKTEFLAFIEEGEYAKLPSVSYAHGFVRNYAKFLGLPEKEIMAIFRREFDEDKTYRVLPKGFGEGDSFPLSKFKLKQTAVLIIVIFLLFMGYILFQYRGAFLNPPLEITSPKNGSLVLSSEVTIIGKTDSNATVYIEKNAVSVDQNGNFKKTINVFPGETTITVNAVNKFSRETDKQIEINVKPGS